MKSTVLVTGCAGFIGSNLCHWILANTSHDVVGVDDLSGGYEENLPNDNRFIFVHLNAGDEYLNNVFSIYKPSTCFALHAYAAEGRSNHIRKFIHQNNTLSMANVINCCVNHECKLVFTSSVAVYSGIPPFDENTPPFPIDCYGISKFTTEMDIQVAGRSQGLEWCIVRPRNVYGVRQSIFDPSRNLLGIWCYQALNDEPLTVFGKGTSKRCFTYVEDILEPLYFASFVDNRVVNLGSPVAYCIVDALNVFREVTGYDNVKFLPPREEVPEATCRIEVSEEILGYKHRTDLRDGVSKMWQWATALKMRPKQTPPYLEITKNAHISLL